MSEFTTPMMKQYQRIKKEYQDCLLFYRMGDFYELFLEDAHIGAKVLDITLTSRAKGRDGRIPMAGVPYHAVDPYVAKLVKAGYKVAICEQVSEPSTKGIVDREVVRIITPGTVVDEKALEKKENNYIVSLCIHGDTLSISACDISTGYIEVVEESSSDIYQLIIDEVARIKPVECILHDDLYSDINVIKTLRVEKSLNIYAFRDWDKYAKHGRKKLLEHFKVQTLESFGIETMHGAIEATSALLGYLQHTQKDRISHIRSIRVTARNTYMMLDRSTMINLELFSTIRDRETSGSLLSVIDYTLTSMGGRQLKQWLKNPLLQKEDILLRHNAVEECLNSTRTQKRIQELLEGISDFERTLSRLAVGIGNPRDLINLKLSLEMCEKIFSQSEELGSPLLHISNKKYLEDISIVIQKIQTIILDEPAINTKEGGIIKAKVDSNLDELRDIVGNGKNWIMKLEQDERIRTGISSLKVRFNKVFGFYIEITKANLHLVPTDYTRKQTMIGGERFSTIELRKQEERILTASDEINKIEYQLFQKTVEEILGYTVSIQAAAQTIATIDCILGFSTLAKRYSYCKPRLLYSGEIRIKQGRHPVVEASLPAQTFVPNDVTLDTVSSQLLVITGPNMAGKSVFIRQVALHVLLSQIGSFVPATSAHLTIVDRIFVRSGASDVITSGLSTFMVEMVETAYILNNATKKSLIIMDEIGRGTSTYDGISIAWAVASYLVTDMKVPAKTLFATHYHELQQLEAEFPNRIKNFHMAVDNDGNVPRFLHTLLPGSASHSFGVAVAKLAGVPNEVIQKATEMLGKLEKRDAIPYQTEKRTPTPAIHSAEIEHIRSLHIADLTPLQALNELAALQSRILDIDT